MAKRTKWAEVELDEVTMRARRNLIVSSTAIIFIKWFDIEVKNVQGAGIELTGLNTENVLSMLLIVMAYNAVTYYFRLIESIEVRWDNIGDIHNLTDLRVIIWNLLFPFVLILLAISSN